MAGDRARPGAPRLRNGNCDDAGTVYRNFRGRGRRAIIDALIAVASLTVALAIAVAIDARSGDQLARAITYSAPPGGRRAVQVHDDAMTLARSMWDMSQMHAPLMTFAGVGAILVLFMIRTK